jgi:hypothetical protein
MVRRALAAALLGIALAAGGCASPTLPLPPPEVPSVSKGSDADHVTLTSSCGGAEDGALIVVINYSAPPEDQVGGAFATSCGSWQASVWAHKGDTLTITQQYGGQDSQSTTVQVQ